MKGAKSMTLETIRAEADQIDDAIAELFEKRLKLVEYLRAAANLHR